MMTTTKYNSLRTFFVLCHILALVFCIAMLIVQALLTFGANAILEHMHITNNSIWWTGIYALFLSAISKAVKEHDRATAEHILSMYRECKINCVRL